MAGRAGGLALAVLVATAGAASAGLKVCNDGAVSRSLAIAYSQGGVWVSEGWWVIEPGTCATPVKGDLAQRHYYWHASQAAADFAGEGFHFCTLSDAFTIEDADGDCAARGQDRLDFRHLDTGADAKSWTLALSDEPVLPKEQDRAEPVDGPLFTSGAFGEPFTQVGVIQGCQTIDAAPYCFLYAEGWRYAASATTGTPDAVLRYLESLPVNAPVQFGGDIVSLGDITAETVLNRAVPAPRDDYADLRDGMQGLWVSADDPQNVLQVAGSEETSIYGNEVQDVLVLTFTDLCDGAPEGGGPYLIKQPMGRDPADAMCYAVISVEPDRMELSVIGRGNTLIYVRG